MTAEERDRERLEVDAMYQEGRRYSRWMNKAARHLRELMLSDDPDAVAKES